MAKTALGHLAIQILVRGGQDADVERLGLLCADGQHVAVFQHAQQFRLLAQRHIADFVKENSAAFRQFEPSNAVRASVSECAFHVTK